MNTVGLAVIGGALVAGVYLATRKERKRTEWDAKLRPLVKETFGTDDYAAAIERQLAELGDEPSAGDVGRAASWWRRHLGTGDTAPVDIFETPDGYANQDLMKREAPALFEALGAFAETTNTLVIVGPWPAPAEDLELLRRELRALARVLEDSTMTTTPWWNPGTLSLSTTFEMLGDNAASVANVLARAAASTAKSAATILAGLGRGFAEGAGTQLIVIAGVAVVALLVLR
jgi:hypothetical protein